VDYEEFTAAMGLDCRYIDRAWAHGRWATGLVAHAGLAVMAGLADYVAIANTNVTRKGYLRHLTGLGGTASQEGNAQHRRWSRGVEHARHRHTGLGHGLGRRALHGQVRRELGGPGRIGIGYRENAAKNPIATLRNKPLTMDSYLQEPVIAGPFRRRDYLAVFGALSLILIPTGVFRSHRVRRWRRI